jgi:hypothetical protein
VEKRNLSRSIAHARAKVVIANDDQGPTRGLTVHACRVVPRAPHGAVNPAVPVRKFEAVLHLPKGSSKTLLY